MELSVLHECGFLLLKQLHIIHKSTIIPSQYQTYNPDNRAIQACLPISPSEYPPQSHPSIVKSETPNPKNLIESNQIYASTFKQGDLALPPAKKYAVGTYFHITHYSLVLHPSYTTPITCMDARINPSAAFGIPLGDAHIIRNARRPTFSHHLPAITGYRRDSAHQTDRVRYADV